MKLNKKLLSFITCVIVLFVVALFIYKNNVSNGASIKVQHFQDIMIDFKKMNLDQADGDIIFFGDSLVQAMSPYALGEKYVNMGVGGYKISQINSLIGISNIQKYKKVVIEGGVNDVLTQSSVDDIKRNYIDLLFVWYKR